MYNSLSALRSARNAKLAETDWMFLADTKELKNEVYLELMKIYRKELRDITNGVTDSTARSVVLPDMPAYVD